MKETEEKLSCQSITGTTPVRTVYTFFKEKHLEYLFPITVATIYTYLFIKVVGH